ncbi:MAG: hypothetical protein ACKPKO_53760, partial [Candidatus Fonsibacter sp.]
MTETLVPRLSWAKADDQLYFEATGGNIEDLELRSDSESDAVRAGSVRIKSALPQCKNSAPRKCAV